MRSNVWSWSHLFLILWRWSHNILILWTRPHKILILSTWSHKITISLNIIIQNLQFTKRLCSQCPHIQDVNEIVLKFQCELKADGCQSSAVFLSLGKRRIFAVCFCVFSIQYYRGHCRVGRQCEFLCRSDWVIHWSIKDNALKNDWSQQLLSGLLARKTIALKHTLNSFSSYHKSREMLRSELEADG